MTEPTPSGTEVPASGAARRDQAPPRRPRLLLLRHGETEWSRDGRHTGVTDVPLTPAGEEQARAAAQVVRPYEPSYVLTSPLQRARRTAELAGLRVDGTDEDLREWEYGEVEGITTKDWQEQRQPGWSVWEHGAPGGEAPAQVGARADRVLERLTARLEGEHPTVALVAHGHLLRVLAARWLGLDAAAGALLRLDPATLSLLGYEHERRVVLVWNAPVAH